VGIRFDFARSNCVLTDYHSELVQMITALELTELSISDYSCALDDPYSLLKSDVAEYFLLRVSVKGLYKMISRWLILSKG